MKRLSLILCTISFVVGIAWLVHAAETRVPSDALQVSPAVIRHSRSQDTTCGNISDEVSSVTILTTTTLVCLWTQNNAVIANWWSTSKSDLGTTNGWYIPTGITPVVLDGFIIGSSSFASPTIRFASTSSTSATVTILEFSDKNQ